jgi:hypothetical protein
MGWKTLKRRFKIKYPVTVREGGEICIRSLFGEDFFVINSDGVLIKRYDDSLDLSKNDELARYRAEFDANPEKLKKAVLAQDVFTKALPVFRYDGNGRIKGAFCERRGWPNVTHDGELMTDGGYFSTFEDALANAVDDLKSGIAWRSKDIDEKRLKVRALVAERKRIECDLDVLLSTKVKSRKR